MQWGDGFFLFRGRCFNTESPRSRGEYSPESETLRRRLESPPLTRGIHYPTTDPPPLFRITPAYAGNTHARNSQSARMRDHPRLRGEYFISPIWLPRLIQSPPLARGIPRSRSISSLILGITPACAGNTDVAKLWLNGFEDHPRLRGEYSPASALVTVYLGSPPLARGIPCSQGRIIFLKGITPACAGNTIICLELHRER